MPGEQRTDHDRDEEIDPANDVPAHTTSIGAIDDLQRDAVRCTSVRAR
jgi:hypothetical protein